MVVLALTVAAFVAFRLSGAEPPEHYVHRGQPAFNFTHSDVLRRRAPSPAGEQVLLEHRRGSLFVQSFAVRRVQLPPYEGDVAGIVPVAAERLLDSLERRHTEFELVGEGKARINEAPGYQVFFRARLGERRLLGRVVMLPEPKPGSRRAVALELLGTPVSGVSTARDMGTNEVLKQPLRSFRFGVERP
jgi:hypothetical protein